MTTSHCKSEATAMYRDDASRARRPGRSLAGSLFAILLLVSLCPAALADRVQLTDGTSLEVDEAWEDTQGVWYRRGGVTHLLERARVRSIERRGSEAAQTEAGERPEWNGAKTQRDRAKTPGDRARPEGDRAKTRGRVQPGAPAGRTLVQVYEGEASKDAALLPTVWIYLVGGARMEVDEASETAEGVWYRRGNLSIFVERARIERVEREQPVTEAAADEVAVATPEKRVRRERMWTTGSQRIDALIRQNGAAYGVDPYLIFCVMEQESHFSSGALSPKGARGLMQLMPATAARFGVRNIFDPRENIEAGARYMRFLLNLFHNNVPLALAGYNAGEGAVMKYGWQVPPYSETREYVRRISDRYQLMRDPQAARKAQPITQTQYAAIKAEAQKETIVAPAYERSIERVRLPNGQSMLVSQ